MIYRVRIRCGSTLEFQFFEFSFELFAREFFDAAIEANGMKEVVLFRGNEIITSCLASESLLSSLLRCSQ